jgi:anti-sigma B factor antagonist
MSELQILVNDSGDVTILTLHGRVTMGDGDLTLRTTIKELVAKGRKKIVIDMEDVPYMDSTGLGELVAGYTSARREKAEIKLANLTHKIRDMMGVVQLLGLFETFPSTDEAMKSFA